MKDKFEMIMKSELNFLLGLQIKQTKRGTFINQEKYTRELIKKFGMENQSKLKKNEQIYKT